MPNVGRFWHKRRPNPHKHYVPEHVGCRYWPDLMKEPCYSRSMSNAIETAKAAARRARFVLVPVTKVEAPQEDALHMEIFLTGGLK